jgi:serine/threonine-protein kinase
MDRPVALKILHPQYANDRQAMREFRQEAMTIACLKHDNVIGVYDFGVSVRHEPYLVMEYVDGVSLEKLLETQPKLDAITFRTVFLQVCEALVAAHEKGIVHCDIKPANMLITQDEINPWVVKLADFGLSKLPRDSFDDQNSSGNKWVAGTPFYMSPEQCAGAGLDYRSDIYSLGCVMFEALTGTKPFIGNTAVQTFSMHFHDEAPRILAVAPEMNFPPLLDECIALMLKKKPEDRIQSVRQIQEVITQVA